MFYFQLPKSAVTSHAINKRVRIIDLQCPVELPRHASNKSFMSNKKCHEEFDKIQLRRSRQRRNSMKNFQSDKIGWLAPDPENAKL